jgi:hypothetical protein
MAAMALNRVALNRLLSIFSICFEYQINTRKGCRPARRNVAFVCWIRPKHLIQHTNQYFSYMDKTERDQQREWASRVEAQYPLLEGCWGFIYGKDYKAPKPCIMDDFITYKLVLGADGYIVIRM